LVTLYRNFPTSAHVLAKPVLFNVTALVITRWL